MNEPLISVFVITYNSSAYIQETLDSIKRQTYRNIEVIISDDCSTDNTFTVCQSWIEDNRDRFIRAELIRTPYNMGVAGNCNNAIKAANGLWLKGLSGDDKLLDCAISEYADYVAKNPECRICFACLSFWGEDNALVEKAKTRYEKIYYPYIRKNWKQQYRRGLRTLLAPGPGLFFQKALWEEIGGFDERYPFCEEDPFTCNVLAAGYRIHFLNKELYGYQVRAGSLGRESGQSDSKRHFDSAYKFFLDSRRRKMLKSGMIFSVYHQSVSMYYHHLLYERYSGYKLCLMKFMMLFSPIFYWTRLSALIRK